MRTPQTVYVNGRIYTADRDFSVAEAFAVDEDVFSAVGSTKEILALCGPDTEVVDLKGQVVLPGLIDAHLHVQRSGELKATLDTHGKSRQEIVAMVAEARKTAKPGDWIIGSGWINDEWKDDPGFPHKEDLDAVCPDIPVFIKRGCRHMTWCNSKAFELAGINENTPDPVGGEIFRNPDGSLWGVVTDQAQRPIQAVIPPLSPERCRKHLAAAQKGFFEAGLTGVHDAGISPMVYNVMKDMYEEGALKVRINAALISTHLADAALLEEDCRKTAKAGLSFGLYGRRLNMRAFKLLSDGSLGARSAWMTEDYSDKPGHRGNAKWNDEELYRFIYPLHKAGFQIWIHAIGDAANHQALDIFKRCQEECPRPDARHRIEHTQILLPEDVERFAKEGVIPTAQTVFVRTDYRNCEDRVGAERTKTSYCWKTLIDTGCVLPNGSDSPVESFDPFLGMYCAVNRMDENGDPAGGWRKEEAMTRVQALRSYTTWPAYASFEENIRGAVQPGMLADFILIDRDLMEIPATEIKDIKVLETYVGGERVYKA